MNVTPHFRLCFWLGLLLSPLAAKAEGIIQTDYMEMPMFSLSLMTRGVDEGMVRVAILVDTKGKLADRLLVAYTHREFAEATLRALDAWKFKPPVQNGQPVEARTEITFDFKATGVVITQTPRDYLENMRERMLGGARIIYSPCTVKEIDRIPVPVSVVPPKYFRDAAARGVQGRVVVSFFIDEQGSVRMPVVVEGDNPELTNASFEAVEKWKFEPPTRRGAPVLVQASQTFNFGMVDKH